MGFSHESPAEFAEWGQGGCVMRGVHCNVRSMDSLSLLGLYSFESSESQRGRAPLKAGDYFNHKGARLILPVFLVLPENSLDLGVKRGRIQQEEFSRDNLKFCI